MVVGRKPLEDVNIFKARREALAARLGEQSALVVFSGEEKYRNSTVEYPFRVDSNFYFLSGFEEPNSVLVILPGKDAASVIFSRSKNKERETWDGFRYGPDAAAVQFGFSVGYSVDDLESKLPQILKGVDTVYTQILQFDSFDRRFGLVLKNLKGLSGRSGLGHPHIADANQLIGEFRIKKDALSLANLRKACEISAETHLEVMKQIKPGMSERYIQGLVQFEFLKRGASREGYNSIVASGNAATTLHYIFNDQPCADGDILLLDAGAEYNYFTGDITRSFPVNGQFTTPQKRIYEAVLDVQLKVIQMVRPGVDYGYIREKSTFWLVEKMVDLGLLSGQPQQLIQEEKYKAFYPHGIGHWLGMDVHDSGLYLSRKSQYTKLEPGMTFTVEPGLYIPADHPTAPKEYLGIGVRIEDNILVTDSGFEVLTSKVPKTVNDIEAVIRKA